MWSKTGEMPEFSRASLNCAVSSGVRSRYPHPLGFRENIWNVLQPASAARVTASAIDPAMETCTPTLIVGVLALLELADGIPSDQEPAGKKDWYGGLLKDIAGGGKDQGTCPARTLFISWRTASFLKGLMINPDAPFFTTSLMVCSW